jgi:urease accessory protein
MNTRTITATGMSTTVTDSALLQLVWLASPALPVGAFSYSEGLEAAVESGDVTTEASTGVWLRDQLLLAQARCDLAVGAAAWRAWQDGDLDRIATLNDWVRQTRETAEFRLQTEQAGRSLADWLRQRADGQDARVAALQALLPAPTWPLALALAGVRSGAPLRAVLLAQAFGWAENMVQAAVRSVPLGQSAGQRLLAMLAQNIPDAVDTAMSLDDGSRQAFTPMLAIRSAQHETQYSRLFRS